MTKSIISSFYLPWPIPTKVTGAIHTKVLKVTTRIELIISCHLSLRYEQTWLQHTLVHQSLDYIKSFSSRFRVSNCADTVVWCVVMILCVAHIYLIIFFKTVVISSLSEFLCFFDSGFEGAPSLWMISLVVACPFPRMITLSLPLDSKLISFYSFVVGRTEELTIKTRNISLTNMLLPCRALSVTFSCCNYEYS